MSSVGISRNSPSNGVFAAPLSVEGIDDNDLDGYIPRDILLKGTRIVIPRPDDTGANDQLMVFWFQNSKETTIFDQNYPSGIVDPFVYVALTSQQMATDGVAQVYYKFWKRGGGNPDESPPRMLTIDHRALLSFPEPLAVDATIWGYWNNNTNPPLPNGGTLRIRPLDNIAQPLDVAWIVWRGYRSLNGSGPEVAEVYGRWSKALSATDIKNGFNYVVPFQNHISSLIDNDSAIVVCQLFRGGKIIAESEKGLVKVDRVTPGKPGPFGLTSQGETIMGIKFVPKKQRPMSTGVSSAAGPFADISVETLADGFIAKAVMDSGKLIINFTRTPDELDGDSIDVKYREKGEPNWTDYPMSIDLDPVAERPVGTIPLPLDAGLFAEKATSPGPTVWELMIELYKGGGGNKEDSKPLEFNVDQLEPVSTKNPPRKIKPTPVPVFVNGTPLPLRNIDRDWITTNPNMNFTINITYFGRRLDDNLTVWLSSATLNSPRFEVFNGQVPAGGTFDIASSELLKFTNGRVNLTYRWDDWLGNLGEESVSTPILTLALPQAPVISRAPLVPETDPNYSAPLYWENFDGGIAAIVENASITNALAGDNVFVVVTRSDDLSNFVDTGKQPWANGNLSFDLTYSNLNQIFNGADEPVEATIHCEIERTNIPNAVSPSRTITLAFDIAGVIPPNPPDLENPDLQLPVVKGMSNVDNVIAATDRDKPGTFKVTNGLADPDIEPGHTVKCYLGSSTTPFEVFSPIVPVSEFEVVIPAGDMAKLTPPSDTARYTIEKTGVGKNVNKSLPQTVVVNRIPVVLPAPTIRIRRPDLRDYIECYAMTSPTSGYVLGLQIAKDPLLPVGTVIEAKFEAHSNAQGTALIAGTAASAPYTIAGPTVPDVAGVGTAAHFKAAQPVRLGREVWGKYWYEAQGGQQSSTPVIKRLDTINNSFQYCDLTEAPV